MASNKLADPQWRHRRAPARRPRPGTTIDHHIRAIVDALPRLTDSEAAAIGQLAATLDARLAATLDDREAAA